MIKKGFTLIELMVVITIIGVLTALSMFAFQHARKSSRDTQRKTDLETIRSALELYKADSGAYPTNSSFMNTSLAYSGHTYLTATPKDPMTGTRDYSYNNSDGIGIIYKLCAALEGSAGNGNTLNCSSCCSSCTPSCNYGIDNP